MAEYAPGGAVPIDDDTPGSFITPFGGSMCQGIDEQYSVTGIHINFDRLFYTVHGCVISHFVFMDMGMFEVGFMTAGNDHRAAVPRADIRSGDEDVNLAAHETAIFETELIPLGAGMATGVQADGFTRLPEVSEVLINK